MICVVSRHPQAADAVRDALIDLVRTYSEHPSVQQVYLATSIFSPSSAMAHQLSGGVIQEIQREAADRAGCKLIDVYELTKDYYDITLHYTDRLHPGDESAGAIAEAVYAGLTGRTPNMPVVPTCEGEVLYVSASGSPRADGTEPSRAINNLAVAAGMLREGGTIVLCGPYNLSYEMHLPQNSGKIMLTSTYGGRDYAKDAGAYLGIGKQLYLNGEYLFEDLTIKNTADNMAIFCNFNNVTFGDGTDLWKGDNIKTKPSLWLDTMWGRGGVPFGKDQLVGKGGSYGEKWHMELYPMRQSSRKQGISPWCYREGWFTGCAYSRRNLYKHGNKSHHRNRNEQCIRQVDTDNIRRCL